MGEGTVFSLFVSPHLGGGTPVRSGGYPIPGLAGGYPIPGLGRGRRRGGYPIQGLDRGGYLGYPPDGGYLGYPQTRSGWGIPPTRSGWGKPPGPGMGSPANLGWDNPPQTWDRVPPPDLGWGTCYAAGGMPLAFTQEDFLVNISFQKVFFFSFLLSKLLIIQ